jgi:hypothetical protein
MTSRATSVLRMMNQDFHIAIRSPASILPNRPLEPFSPPFHPERLSSGTKVPALPLPGTGKPETDLFSSDFSQLGTATALPDSCEMKPQRQRRRMGGRRCCPRFPDSPILPKRIVSGSSGTRTLALLASGDCDRQPRSVELRRPVPAHGPATGRETAISESGPHGSRLVESGRVQAGTIFSVASLFGSEAGSSKDSKRHTP